MARADRRLFRTVILLLMATIPLAGQDQERTALARLRREIASLEKSLEQIRGRASTERNRLGLVEEEIAVQTRQLLAAEVAVDEITRDRLRGEQRLQELTRRNETQKDALARRMVALYKMGDLSYLRLLLSGELDPASLGLLNYLVKRDARLIEEYQATSRALQGERQMLLERQLEADEVVRILDAKRSELESTRADQRRLIAELESRARGEQERLTDLEEKAARLNRLLSVLAGEGSAASGGIAQFRGALGWPVTGEVLERFGRQRSRKFETFTVNNGIRIAAAPGSEVRPVFGGTVIYSQWFKGYGNLIIVDHGDRIFTLYGNLRSSAVERGTKVAPQDRIGTVEVDGSGPGGALYFEVRVNNEPVDPMGWLR